MRSIEHPFEHLSQKGSIMALAAPFPAAGSTRLSTRPVRPSVIRHPDSCASLRPASSSLSLTRRGRAVLILASTLMLLVAFMLSGRTTADAGPSMLEQGRATGVVVVEPGENLWQIARAVAPNADPRETVATIRALNGLADSSVVAGQSIVVPISR